MQGLLVQDPHSVQQPSNRFQEPEARTGSGACVLMWGISNVAATGLTGELLEPQTSHAPIKSESVGWGWGNQ